MARPAALEPSDWVEDADQWIEQRAAQPGHFTADDLRRAVPDAPSPKLPGLAFGRASRRGLIVSDYTQRSRARSRNGGIQRIWRGATEGDNQ